MKNKILWFILILVLAGSGLRAQPDPGISYEDTLNFNLRLLKRYISQGSKWHFTDHLTGKRLQGLIHFIENEPVDTIINHMRRIRNQEGIILMVRRPRDVTDSLSVRGFIPYAQLLRQLESIDEEVRKEYEDRPVAVPEEMLKSAEMQLPLIPSGMGMELFNDGIFKMPDSLKILDAIPEEMVQTPGDFRRILALDSIRIRFVEQKRLQFNDSLLRITRKRITSEYRQQLINERSIFLKAQKTEAVKRNNEQVLKFHNDQVIKAVNDSIIVALDWLKDFADLIDNTTVNLVNLSNASSSLVLSNAGSFFTRVWLKNQQNDSLAVLVQNLDKRSMQLVIEDAVTFTRFKQQAVKDFDFTSLNKPSVNLDKISRRYQAYTPWTIGGDGNLGFTQTYLENWKKGGKSALSILVVAKSFANFSSEKLKWENSAEIRNGWIKPGDDGIQKNDDKFEITSRLGYSAFKKWYYSTEVDFETQFFNGYKYPDRTRVISGFLAPGRFLFKIGLDYKPSKNFSLFISPLTSKTVFVSDTLKVDKSSFGIKPGKNSFWEPGLNTDIKFRKEITPDIVYDTKYRMFINYRAPFNQTDMEWENNLNIQVTDYIAVRMMVHSIYDSKVLFDKLDKSGAPVLDADGNKIRKARLQLKEFITVGFSYRINRRVLRAREIK